MHQWIEDSGMTPHLVVAADVQGVEVPRAHVRDGKIVLNVAYSATHRLELGNEWIEFGARFGGVARQVRIPVAAVLGIYARETGEGIVFSEADLAGLGAMPADASTASPEPPRDEPPPTDGGPGGGGAPASRPRLRIVK